MYIWSILVFTIIFNIIYFYDIFWKDLTNINTIIIQDHYILNDNKIIPIPRSKPEYEIDVNYIKNIIVKQTENTLVPPSLALAVANVESNFNPMAKSKSGAIGIMQIMPLTGKELFNVSEIELWDYNINIKLGIIFLDNLYKRYKRWDLVLSHYNSGSVKRVNSSLKPRDITTNYIKKVQAWQGYYQSKGYQ